MTKEEAIYNLKALLTMGDFRDAYGDSICAEPYYEAVDAAVEALKNLQPTCNQLATDCISRQAAIDALDNIKIQRNASWYTFYQRALTAMSNLPSAQPERKKGKWIDEGKIVPLNEFGCTTGWCECSECGKWLVASDEYSIHGNYCPNCGADMRGEQK